MTNAPVWAAAGDTVGRNPNGQGQTDTYGSVWIATGFIAAQLEKVLPLNCFEPKRFELITLTYIKSDLPKIKFITRI